MLIYGIILTRRCLCDNNIITEVVNVPEASDNAVICIDPDITGNMDSALTVVLEFNNGQAGKKQ